MTKFINGIYYNIHMSSRYRGSAYTYKIRQLTKNNVTGDAFGITINKTVASQFEGVDLKQYVSGNCIILESGNKDTIKEQIINKQKWSTNNER